MKHLTTKELAKRLRMNPDSIHNWRAKNRGPRWIKCGGKVLYPTPEIEAWEKRHLKGPK